MLVIFYSLSSSSIAKNQLVYFEPQLVELNGVIKMLTFPGPPNYENTKNGDADETGPYLILNNPIDVRLVPKVQIGNDEPENNVKIIQLVVCNDKDWQKVKEGNYVNITGKLFRALTGHHHARILLIINKIKILSTRKIVRYNLDMTVEDRQFIQYQHLQN